MIRLGTINDTPAIIRVGQKALDRAESPLNKIDRRAVFRHVESFVSTPDQLFLVGEHDGTVQGFVMAMCVAPWWSDPKHGVRYVTDFAFCSNVAGDGKRMLAGVRKWAWTRPRVKEVVMAKSLPGNDTAAHRLYQASGYKYVGGVYTCSKEEDE